MQATPGGILATKPIEGMPTGILFFVPTPVKGGTKCLWIELRSKSAAEKGVTVASVFVASDLYRGEDLMEVMGATAAASGSWQNRGSTPWLRAPIENNGELAGEFMEWAPGDTANPPRT